MKHVLVSSVELYQGFKSYDFKSPEAFHFCPNPCHPSISKESLEMVMLLMYVVHTSVVVARLVTVMTC